MILAKKWGNDLFQDFYPDGWQTKMFDEFFNRSKGGTHDWSPPTDIVETEKEYIVEMEIPGMKEEDIKVSLNENFITVKGKIGQENGPVINSLLVERFTGSFERTFNLPTNRLDSLSSKAKFENGILTITITKAEEIQPREIKIT